MNFNHEISETEAQPVVSIRITSSTRNLLTDLKDNFMKILEYLKELGEKPAGAPFAAYYNWKKDSLDVELGFPVESSIDGKGEITANEIPAGKKASMYYKGKLQKIGPAYKDLTDWIEFKGYQPGVNYEFYENFLEEVSQDELLTKIMYLLLEDNID